MIETNLKIIGKAATEEHLPFRELVRELRTGFAQGCVVPVRHHHTMERREEPGATLLLMPAWSKQDDQLQYLGIKLVTVVPGNQGRNIPALTSTYLLFDGITGEQLALMDGNTITGRRTVATSALAADYLAREDASKLLVLGSGRVASLLPDAFAAVRPIKEVAIWDIDCESASRLAASLSARGFSAKVVDDLESAAGAADIVSAATLATSPIIKGAWLQAGTHVDLIGSFTPEMREADDDVMRRSTVFVDVVEALQESGDILQPMQAGVIGKADVRATLAELARGIASGRTSQDEITCFKTVGSALADLVAAKMVHERSQPGYQAK